MGKRYHPRSGRRRYYKRRSGILGYISSLRITDMLVLAVIGLAGVSWIGSKLGGSDDEGPVGLMSSSSSDNVYYRYCRDARAAGAAPLHRGDPGYRLELDADNDGVACEPYYGR